MKQIAILSCIITLSIIAFKSSAINKSHPNTVDVVQDSLNTTQKTKQQKENDTDGGFDLFGINIKSGQNINAYRRGSTVTIGDYELQFAGYDKAINYKGVAKSSKAKLKG